MNPETHLLEKHSIEIGEYDEEGYSYKILSGLTPEDCLVLPQDYLTEGMPVMSSADLIAAEEEMGEGAMPEVF